MKKLYLIQEFQSLKKKSKSTHRIRDYFRQLGVFQAILRPKSVQNGSFFYPFLNSSVKLSHYQKTGPYTRILFIFKKMIKYPHDLGPFWPIQVFQAILWPKSVQTGSIFFLISSLSIKLSYNEKIVPYLRILVTQKKSKSTHLIRDYFW